MAGELKPIFHTPVMHFDDINGRPLVGGSLYSYKAGTNTPVNLYRDNQGTLLHENPIRLNMRGECVAYGKEGLLYKLVLKDRFGATIWEVDNVRSALQFDVVGNDQIEVTTTMVAGKKILTLSIKPNSIGREQLKNAHNLVPDSRYLQFKDFNGNVVVTLCDSLMEWLETEGYTA